MKHINKLICVLLCVFLLISILPISNAVELKSYEISAAQGADVVCENVEVLENGNVVVYPVPRKGRDVVLDIVLKSVDK